MRPSLAALAAALVAGLALCAPAWAAADVTLAPEGGSEQALGIEAVPDALWVRDRQYAVRGGPRGDTTITVTGVTLDRLLDQAGIDPFAFEGAEVTGGGRTVALGRDELTDVHAFPDGRPIFWVDEQGTHFLRPSGGPGDANADDLLTVNEGPLRVALQTSGGLTVKATASPLRIRSGQRVTFNATVSGPGSEQAPVRWYFDDQRSASGSHVVHRFARAGTYDVTVSAGASADVVGADDVVTIQVGKPRDDGPDRKGGGTDSDAAAPDSGAALGGSGSSGHKAPAPPARSRPPKPSRPPVPRGSTPAPEELAGTPTPGEGEHVEGVLLSDASTSPTQATADALRAARTGTPKAPHTVGGSLPPAVWGLLAAVAALGLGAWRERRGLVRRVRAG